MTTRHGDILEVERGVILHQVNALGAMGSGVALALRRRYPEVWAAYSAEINPQVNGTHPAGAAHHLGRLQLVPVGPRKDDGELWVANAVAQLSCRLGPSDSARYTSYDALDEAIATLAEWNRQPRLPVHYPLIGAGLGGGHWPVIREILNHRLAGFDRCLWLLPGSVEPS